MLGQFDVRLSVSLLSCLSSASHGRWGLVAVASVVLVVVVMTLAFLTYCGVKRGLSGQSRSSDAPGVHDPCGIDVLHLKLREN